MSEAVTKYVWGNKIGALWFVGGRPVFFTLPVRIERNRRAEDLNVSAPAVRTFLEALARERWLVSVGGVPYLCVNGEYRFAGLNRVAAQDMLDDMMSFATRAQLPLEGDLVAPEKLSNDEREKTPPLHELLGDGVEGQYALSQAPRRYAESVIAAGQSGRAPEIDGLLLHPIAGQARGLWIERKVWRSPTGPPAPNFPHLRRLFSAFDGHWSPASHAALHMYLLGAFHACSLENEKPILFVDSQHRGRGKSEVCDAIQILLEGRRCALTISPNRQAFEETLVAHLNGGARTIPVHNLEGVADYANATFASIATEGAIAPRAKYKGETSRFPGALPIFNGVYGAFSLHKDFLCRCWRVELPGEAQALNPRPREYAEAHRDAIIAEILAAHEPFKVGFPLPPPVTRFAAFEAAAALAYGRAFSLPPGEVTARLKKMQVGATALLQSGVQSLYSVHPSAFEAPHTDVVGSPYSAGKKELPPAGACALGFTFSGDTWNAIDNT